jgi:hypothetical protein
LVLPYSVCSMPSAAPPASGLTAGRHGVDAGTTFVLGRIGVTAAIKTPHRATPILRGRVRPPHVRAAGRRGAGPSALARTLRRGRLRANKSRTRDRHGRNIGSRLVSRRAPHPKVNSEWRSVQLPWLSGRPCRGRLSSSPRTAARAANSASRRAPRRPRARSEPRQRLGYHPVELTTPAAAPAAPSAPASARTPSSRSGRPRGGERGARRDERMNRRASTDGRRTEPPTGLPVRAS